MTKDLEILFLKGLEEQKDKLFRICTNYSTDSDEAKDLFQEALASIWQSMSSFKENASIGTWMFRVTINVCLRLHSSQKKKYALFKKTDSGILENISITEENSEQNQLFIHLQSCIKKLNDVDKSVITLYLEELSYKQISEITGLSENNITVKIKRIKIKLFNCINKQS